MKVYVLPADVMVDEAAFVHVGGKTHALGRFESELDAARAYNEAALLAWGEFASLNEVGDAQ